MNGYGDDLHLDERARRALAVGLDALAARGDRPLRVRDHHAHGRHDVFEVVEEPEHGGPARRFLVSVGGAADGLVILGGAS